MNLRPSGYEPDELPACSTPRRYGWFSVMHHIFNGAGDRDRTGTRVYPRRILSPVRLPVPPLRPMPS